MYPFVRTSRYRSPKFLSVLTLALAVSFSGSVGCGGKVGSFTFTKKSDEKTVEGSLAGKVGAATPFANPFKFEINLERQLEKRDAKGAKAVYLSDLKFKVTDNEDKFDFLDSIIFSANAEGKKKREVARKDPVPKGVKKFSFDVDGDVDLKPYVKKGLQLHADVEGSPPPEDRSFRAILTLRVETL